MGGIGEAEQEHLCREQHRSSGSCTLDHCQIRGEKKQLALPTTVFSFVVYPFIPLPGSRVGT